MEPSRSPKRMSRWVLAAGLLASLSLLTALLAFGLQRDGTAIRSPLVGRPAPDFSLRTLDGDSRVSLSDLRGQVVVVNFWASWCKECRIEHPALQAAWSRYRDRGVVLLGIPFQDRAADSRKYAAELGGDWPVLSDPGSKTAIAYGVFGVPETFFITADGRVAGKRIGPVSYEYLTTEISRLLAQRGQAS